MCQKRRSYRTIRSRASGIEDRVTIEREDGRPGDRGKGPGAVKPDKRHSGCRRERNLVTTESIVERDASAAKKLSTFYPESSGGTLVADADRIMKRDRSRLKSVTVKRTELHVVERQMEYRARLRSIRGRFCAPAFPGARTFGAIEGSTNG